MKGRTIALAVSGSIASYKAVEVARLCIKAGFRVIPLMTASATRFIGPITLTGICGEPTAIDMWDPSVAGERHVAIAEAADLVVIVPATADTLAKLAGGRADDLVTATVLCARGPVLVAPAMHPRMWAHPAVRHNVAELHRQGRVVFVGPVAGLVASGDSGMGRMAEPAAIFLAIEEALRQIEPHRRDLGGTHVLVTAGPTYEPLDPVRFLGNRSSGKMGFALASRAVARGARVTLVAGPVSLPTPLGVTRVDVRTAEEMRAALNEVDADAIVMAAAVADHRPAHVHDAKIKKADAMTLELVKNPDLIGEIGARRRGKRPILVAFALETGKDADVVAYARRKRIDKKVDLVVANAADQSLGRETNRVALVGADGDSPFEEGTKETVADRILDRLVTFVKQMARGEGQS